MASAIAAALSASACSRVGGYHVLLSSPAGPLPGSVFSVSCRGGRWRKRAPFLSAFNLHLNGRRGRGGGVGDVGCPCRAGGAMADHLPTRLVIAGNSLYDGPGPTDVGLRPRGVWKNRLYLGGFLLGEKIGPYTLGPSFVARLLRSRRRLQDESLAVYEIRQPVELLEQVL